MFDRFVSGTRPSWSRRGVLLASLAMHGVLGLALLVASFFHVAEIASPALAIVFVSAPPPPPGGDEGAARAKPQHARPRPRVQLSHALTVQPQPTPPPVVDPPPGNVPDGNDDDGGGSGGGPGGPGHGPGVPGGQGTGPVASLPPPKPMNVPPHKLDAQRIAGADPHLPFAMIKAHAGERGLGFIARLCVDQSGRVSQVNVVQSLPGADENIVGELRQWRYKPQPIPVCFMANFVFDVEGQR